MGFKAILFLSLVAAATAGKIHESLLSKSAQKTNPDIIIQFPNNLNKIVQSAQFSSLSGAAKTKTLASLLKQDTIAAQANLMSVINSKGVNAKQFWIWNKISIKNAAPQLIQSLAAVKGDFVIREAATVSILPSVGASRVVSIKQEDAQWGVAKIGAPEAWQTTRGEGVTVGIIDTGANVQHEALETNFAGGWLDTYHGSDVPDDTNGHGSHALGSIVGTTNGIGVAPGAQWHACRGLANNGSGFEENLIDCAQFLLEAEPTPALISNSWGGNAGGDGFYNGEVDAWRAADIIPLFAIGNGRSIFGFPIYGCDTANSPGDQPNLISVGATDINDDLAEFSSRGTDQQFKPEISAPGVDIVSAGRGNTQYAENSGTSMATPHVAGAVALYLSANPGASFDQVLNALQSTAVQPALVADDRDCGTAADGDYPNNAYGHGRINIAAAINA